MLKKQGISFDPNHALIDLRRHLRGFTCFPAIYPGLTRLHPNTRNTGARWGPAWARAVSPFGLGNGGLFPSSRCVGLVLIFPHNPSVPYPRRSQSAIYHPCGRD